MSRTTHVASRRTCICRISRHVYHWAFSGLPLQGRLRDCQLLIGRDLLAYYRLEYDGPAGTVYLESNG